MPDTIKEFVLRLIEKKGRLPRSVDVDSFNYIDTGYIDSLGIIKFVVAIEAAYDIEIANADIESPEFRTVGGLVAIIMKKLESKRSC